MSTEATFNSGVSMKVVCVKSVKGVFGTGKNAPKWSDLLFPIKDLVYTVTRQRVDCEGDVGYEIENLDGWWSSTLFRKIEMSDFNYESIEELMEQTLNAVT